MPPVTAVNAAANPGCQAITSRIMLGQVHPGQHARDAGPQVGQARRVIQGVVLAHVQPPVGVDADAHHWAVRCRAAVARQAASRSAACAASSVGRVLGQLQGAQRRALGVVPRAVRPAAGPAGRTSGRRPRRRCRGGSGRCGTAPARRTRRRCGPRMPPGGPWGTPAAATSRPAPGPRRPGGRPGIPSVPARSAGIEQPGQAPHRGEHLLRVGGRPELDHPAQHLHEPAHRGVPLDDLARHCPIRIRVRRRDELLHPRPPPPAAAPVTRPRCRSPSHTSSERDVLAPLRGLEQHLHRRREHPGVPGLPGVAVQLLLDPRSCAARPISSLDMNTSNSSRASSVAVTSSQRTVASSVAILRRYG